MGDVIHLTDDVDHLDVAIAALEQARIYASGAHGFRRDACGPAINQLCAWIEWTEDDDDLDGDDPA